MEMTKVFTGKSIDDAVEGALAQLGVGRDDITYQVLALPKAGFLGFGKQDAKIQVTYQVPDPIPEKPKGALGSASRSKPKAKPVAEKKPEAPVGNGLARSEKPKAPVAKAEAPVGNGLARSEKPKAPVAKAEAPVGNGLARSEKPKAEKKPAEPKVYAPAAEGSLEQKIEVFLKGLLEHMGSNAVPHAVKADEHTYKVELVGDDLGYLIGRRGDTLDALQHLANYAVGRNAEGHIRINVDAEDYRAKREDSLRRYARKKAQQVLKARRRTTLEPMNAYERHVIHAALQDMENITTHSTGTEPNRRVVIEFVR